MNQQTNVHLNQDAVLRWQMGDATETEQAHVSTCADCQAQTKPLSEALGWFGAAAREWGEAKSAAAQEWRDAKFAATQEWEESKRAAAQKWRMMTATWVAAGVTLLLIFSIGMPHWQARHAAIEAQARQQQRQQELVRDNALLEEVDQDVSQVVPEAMEPLSWDVTKSNAASSQSGTASGALVRQ